jgi:hypothetical protein
LSPPSSLTLLRRPQIFYKPISYYVAPEESSEEPEEQSSEDEGFDAKKQVCLCFLHVRVVFDRRKKQRIHTCAEQEAGQNKGPE